MRSFVISLILLIYLQTPVMAIEPLSGYFIFKGIDKGLDLLLPDRKPLPPPQIIREKQGKAGILSNSAYVAGFYPNGTAEEVLFDFTNNTKKSLYIICKKLDNIKIIKQLAKMAKNGIRIMIVTDTAHNIRYNSFTGILLSCGVKIRFYDSGLNEFFAVADGQNIIIGDIMLDKEMTSNILTIYNSKSLAETYLHEINRLWNTGKDVILKR